MATLPRILGIDPGLGITGYAVLESGARPIVLEAGILRGEKKLPLPERVRVLHEGLTEIVRQFTPLFMAVEQLYAHYAHPRTAILMGHARGVILLTAALHDVAVVSYGATRIKKTITGSGRAGKDQVQRTIQRELGLRDLPEPPDVADALAVALCHHYLRGTAAALPS